MSTSATIQFIDDTTKVAVYSHGDGYPTGIRAMLEKALAFAWELPRFEADEFAAAFIAANKTRGGGFRVTSMASNIITQLNLRLAIYGSPVTSSVRMISASFWIRVLWAL